MVNCLRIYTVGFTDGNLVRTPSNVTVKVGVGFRLNCSTDDDVKPIHWHLNMSRISHGINGSDIIPSLRGRCHVDKSVPKQFDLICEAVDVRLSGEYTCEEYNANTSTAYVSVREGKPVSSESSQA